MSTARAVALIDMDGTLCDYAGALARDLRALVGPGETPPPDGDEPAYLRARRALVTRQSGWWLGLARLRAGFYVLARLKALGFEPHVLTKGPNDNPLAWQEKLSWCRAWLPGVPVTVTSDKGLMYGRVLVDDWPPYLESWLAFRPRGQVVMPAQPWNRGFRHPRVLRFDGRNRVALERVLRAARDRKPGAE